MKVSSRTYTGSRAWLAFLVSAIAICLAFGLLGIASGAASAAPEKSSSTTAVVASSTTAEDDADLAAADVTASEEFEGQLVLGDDLLLANDSLTSDGDTVLANLFAAGNSVNLNNSTVGADAFIAGEHITVTKLAAKNNVFLAGNNITVSGTTGKTIFAAGNNLDIATDAIDLNAAGRTIFLKGTYEGDVNVTASNVVVDPYIVVKGTLNVSAAQEPTIASTAKIGQYNFTMVEEDKNPGISTDFSKIGSPEWIQQLIWSLVGLLALGIVMLLVLRTEVVDSMGRLTRNRPVAILITGLLSVILMPVLIFGLLILVASAPISLLLFLIGIAIVVMSIAYTSIALGRTILPRVNKWITSILFLAIFGVLMSLPVVAFILAALCCIFTFGSIIQGWWVWRRGKELPNDHVDEYGQEEFTVPRGEHFATGQSGTVASRPLVPSNLGEAVDNPITPDEPRNW